MYAGCGLCGDLLAADLMCFTSVDAVQRQLEDYQHMFGDWTKKEM